MELAYELVRQLGIYQKVATTESRFLSKELYMFIMGLQQSIFLRQAAADQIQNMQGRYGHTTYLVADLSSIFTFLEP